MNKKKVKKTKKENKIKKHPPHVKVLDSKLADTFKDKIFLHALVNASGHDGKAQVGAVLPKLFQDGLKKEQIREIMPLIAKSVEEVNSMTIEQQKLKLESLGFEKEIKEEKHDLPELPNVHGKVVLRLAPYPSGALHIGNAKTYLLNALYAEKYNAKLLLMIDDTIGSKEKQIMPEAYKLIPEAFDWLNVKYEKPILYKSDRLKIYYKYAEELIKKGFAYVCHCAPKILQENRKNGIECEHRKQTPKEALLEWKKMFKAKEGSSILRIKTGRKDKNPAFRDRVLFRISERSHPRVRKRYRIWPMLEFSWAIDDHLLGITHVIRGKDLMMESEMEKFIWKIFKWDAPELLHAGLVRIEGLEGVKLSKSKAQQEVKSGKFIGWDDPRTWSIQSLRRRGIRAETIREFVKNIGLNQNDIIVPIDNLYALNKKIVDETGNRYFFVKEPVKIKVKNAPRMIAKLPLHPKHAERGYRILQVEGDEFYIQKTDYEIIKKSEQDIFRFMNLFNFKKVKKGKEIKDFEFHSKEMQPLLNAKMIHWLPANKGIVDTEILMPDGTTIKGFAEQTVKQLEPDTVIQFERFGFVRLDKKAHDKFVFWFAHE